MLAGSAAMLFICYQFSIKQTISEYRKHKELTQTIADALNTGNISDLKNEYQQVNRILNDYKLDTLNPARSLLGVISRYCSLNELSVKEYKPVGWNNVENISVFNRYIVVEGSFNECLKLVYELENNEKIGRLVSVNYKSYEDKKTGTVKLNCVIYVQNVI